MENFFTHDKWCFKVIRKNREFLVLSSPSGTPSNSNIPSPIQLCIPSLSYSRRLLFLMSWSSEPTDFPLFSFSSTVFLWCGRTQTLWYLVPNGLHSVTACSRWNLTCPSYVLSTGSWIWDGDHIAETTQIQTINMGTGQVLHCFMRT